MNDDKTLYNLSNLKIKENNYTTKLKLDEITTKEDISHLRKKVAIQYLLGLSWTYTLYTTSQNNLNENRNKKSKYGIASWSWFYNYHYPPFIRDFGLVTLDDIYEEIKKMELGEPLSLLEQACVVLPPGSRNNVPRCLWEMYKVTGVDSSGCLDMNRSNVEEKVCINTEENITNFSNEENKCIDNSKMKYIGLERNNLEKLDINNQEELNLNYQDKKYMNMKRNDERKIFLNNQENTGIYIKKDQNKRVEKVNIKENIKENKNEIKIREKEENSSKNTKTFDNTHFKIQNIEIDYFDKLLPWQGIPLLKFIDIDKIKQKFKEIKESGKYTIKEMYKNTFGQDIMFCNSNSRNNNTGKIIKNMLYSSSTNNFNVKKIDVGFGYAKRYCYGKEGKKVVSAVFEMYDI